MGGWSSVISAWDIEPSIVLGCAGLLLADAAVSGWRVSRVSGWFVLAVLVLAVALMSPLDALSDGYLFSAHMLQHLLLIVVVSPLLLIGLPEAPLRRFLHLRWPARLERILGWAPLAWSLGIVTFACWHVPVLYNAALADENVHILEHLSFLVSAAIFWWPILAPIPECRTSLVPALLYLLAGTFANGLIGLVLLVLPVGFYPAYLHPDDPLHILPLIRGTWGFTPAEDQQFGAVLMIIGGATAFMWATAYMLFLHRNDEPAAPAAPQKQPAANVFSPASSDGSGQSPTSTTIVLPNRR